MLYSLSADVYQDLTNMYDNSHCKYDTTNSKLLTDLVPNNVQLCSTISLLTLAAREVYNSGVWQHATLMCRTWTSSIYDFTGNAIDLNFKHRDKDKGFWAYRFASCGSTKLLISSPVFSSYVSVIGGVPYYQIDNGLLKGEYTISEIAKSNQRFMMDAVFPSEPRMFADDRVEYMIPYTLIL